jgi:uncharacterized membrane protein YphA (DoxX/SURF4 family)
MGRGSFVARIEPAHRRKDPIMTTHSLTQVAPSSSSARRYAIHAARVLLGLVFFVFGLMGLFNLIPPPQGGVPAGAMAFGAALMNTGYMFPLIKGTEVLGGALLLSNRFVPLALVLLAPVVVNIFLFHLFLTPGEIGMASLVLATEAGLGWVYRAHYRALFSASTAAA